MADEFAAGVFDELLERNACLTKATLKCSRTHPDLMGHVFERRAVSSQQSSEDLLHLFAYLTIRPV